MMAPGQMDSTTQMSRIGVASTSKYSARPPHTPASLVSEWDRARHHAEHNPQHPNQCGVESKINPYSAANPGDLSVGHRPLQPRPREGGTGRLALSGTTMGAKSRVDLDLARAMSTVHQRGLPQHCLRIRRTRCSAFGRRATW